MEVRKGYKQTEVGVIPEDWEIRSLGEVAFLKRGKFTPRPRNNPIYYGGDIPFVQTGDVTNSNGRILNYTQTLNEDGLAVSALFKKGTILMTIAANIGYSGILQIDMACPDSLVAIDGLNDADNIFLNYYFSYKRQELDGLSTAGTQKNLNIELLKPFKIPLPPTISEQAAIATALSDADALIANLEKLIEKKRAIKQGAMQELLRPKEGWEVKKLSECLKIRHGKSQKEVEDSSGQYPILGTGGLMSYTNHFLYDKPSVLIGRKGTIDKPQFMDSPFWTVDTLFYTEINSDISPKFMYYRFLLIDWYSHNEASGVPSLNAKTIENIEISIPTFETQTRIATILSDMDAEITALEQKLAKYKQIKQGMMQELLTGRIRLII